MSRYSAVAEAIERSGIRAIMDLAAGRRGVLHLVAGEPDFPTPSHVLEAAAEAGRQGYTHYTLNKGLPELQESIVRKLRRRNGIDARPEQVVVTCGACNGLMAAFSALLDPGDLVLVPDPGWPNFEMMIRARHAGVVRYPLRPETGFQPDMEAFEGLVASTPSLKAILLNTPANPTGAVFPARTVERIVEIARARDVFVVSDDVYEDMVFDESPPPVAASFDTDGRVISVFSVSKSYAMTGWRVGYVVAEREIADIIAKMQEAIVSCASSIGQKAAQAAIDGDQSCVETMRRSYRDRRNLAADVLTGAGLLAARPAGAFYAMCDVSRTGLSGEAFAKRLLLERNVAVAPGETFGPRGQGMVRVSLATAPDILEEALKRLASAVEDWS